MNASTATIIKYRLERAKESLAEAHILFKNEKFYSTVNRTYYAMFYSVNALLLSKGLSSSKHSGVKSLFSKEFVKNGLIEKGSGRFYSKMMERRQKGDYKDLVEFRREEVERWLEKAEKFIKRIEKLIKKIVHESNNTT